MPLCPTLSPVARHLPCRVRAVAFKTECLAALALRGARCNHRLGTTAAFGARLGCISKTSPFDSMLDCGASVCIELFAYCTSCFGVGLRFSKDPALLQLVCRTTGGRAFLKQSWQRMVGAAQRAAALARLPRGFVDEHFPEWPEQAAHPEAVPAPPARPAATPRAARKRPAAALGGWCAVGQLAAAPSAMRRRRTKGPPVPGAAPVAPAGDAAAALFGPAPPEGLRAEQAAQPERDQLGERRLRRCGQCRWLGVPERGQRCPSGCGAPTPNAAAEELFYHGPWGRYNKKLDPGMTALTPERLETLLGELAVEDKGQRQLSREYGVPQPTLARWQNDPAAIEHSLADHTKAISLIHRGRTQAAVLTECAVHTAFLSAVLEDVPAAANSWKAEAARRFGLLQAGATTPGALQVGLGPLGQWMQVPSWSLCPRCGLRSTEAPVTPGWRRNAVVRWRNLVGVVVTAARKNWRLSRVTGSCQEAASSWPTWSRKPATGMI